MTKTYTVADAWREIGHAYATYAATGKCSRLTEHGLCSAIIGFLRRNANNVEGVENGEYWQSEAYDTMKRQVWDELQPTGRIFLSNYGRKYALDRAALAYLFAAELEQQGEL